MNRSQSQFSSSVTHIHLELERDQFIVWSRGKPLSYLRMWEGEEEKKVLYDRLASLENELQRRDELIDSLNTDKSKLVEELENAQRTKKNLVQRIEELENVEYETSGQNNWCFHVTYC